MSLPNRDELRQAITDRRLEVASCEALLGPAREKVSTLGAAFDAALANASEAGEARSKAAAVFVENPSDENEAALHACDNKVRSTGLLVDAAGVKLQHATAALQTAEAGIAHGNAKIADVENQIAAHPETTREASAPLLLDLVSRVRSLTDIVGKLDAIGQAAQKAGRPNPPDQSHLLVPMLDQLAESGRALSETQLRDFRYMAKHCDPNGHPRSTEVGGMVDFILRAWALPPAKPQDLALFRAEIARLKAHRTAGLALKQKAADDRAVDAARTSRGVARPAPANVDEAIGRAFPGLAPDDPQYLSPRATPRSRLT